MDSDPSKKHAFDLMGAGREASMTDFNSFMKNGAGFQLAALHRPLEPDTVVRLICVRHGMGHHNDAFQTASFMNRDAELNRVGISQATVTGKLLRSAGLFDKMERLLVVVSPFCRTLQTAVVVLGTDEWSHPTIVQPLAAETSVASRLPGPRLARKVVANVQQGAGPTQTLACGQAATFCFVTPDYRAPGRLPPWVISSPPSNRRSWVDPCYAS